MARDAARSCSIVRRELNAVSGFEFADLVIGEPDRNLDRDGARVIRKHEILQRLVPQLVVADSGDDESRRGRCRVHFAIDDEAVDISERRLRLRGARFRIAILAKQFVRARRRNVLQKGRESLEALMLRIAAQERERRRRSDGDRA